MSYTDNLRQIQLLISIVATAFVLSACLNQEKDATNFNGPGDPPSDNAPPVISGNPAGAVIVGDQYSFTPNASDADGDPLTFKIDNQPVWAQFNESTGTLSGQPTLGDVGVYSNIIISVNDTHVDASLPSFSISVDQVGTASVSLSWTPPSENDDGSPLMDLAGYKIYWGTTPGSYPNSVTLDNPGLSSYVVDNLAPGTYTFVATSFNDARVESVYSNPVTKAAQP